MNTTRKTISSAFFGGSGNGEQIAANKVRGARASVCHDTYSAAQGVEHDAMNILCLGSRIIGEELARALVRAFAGAQFSTDPRFQRQYSPGQVGLYEFQRDLAEAENARLKADMDKARQAADPATVAALVKAELAKVLQQQGLNTVDVGTPQGLSLIHI